jgi:hypothetical protein
MSKAFDSIDHELLISKLEDVGVSNMTLLWFRSYLSNRKQVVKIHTTKSELLPVVHRIVLLLKLAVNCCTYNNDPY